MLNTQKYFLKFFNVNIMYCISENIHCLFLISSCGGRNLGMSPPNIETTLGSVELFRCYFDGPTVWLFNNSKLPENAFLELGIDRNIHVLWIRYVNEHNVGCYSCKSNHQGASFYYNATLSISSKLLLENNF